MAKFLNINPEANLNWTDQPSMYDHMLNVTQGLFGGANGIDVSLPLDATITDKLAVAGKVVYNDGGVFKIAPKSSGNYLPFLAKPAGGYEGVPPMGNIYGDNIVAIPVTASYRVQTTEFVPGGTYTSNVFLKVNNGQTSQHPEYKGMVEDGGVPFTDVIVGICLGGTETNGTQLEAGRTLVEFMTYFLPGAQG